MKYDLLKGLGKTGKFLITVTVPLLLSTFMTTDLANATLMDVISKTVNSPVNLATVTVGGLITFIWNLIKIKMQEK